MCDNNRNCTGATKGNYGEVRRVRLLGNIYAALCKTCFLHEVRWQRERNEYILDTGEWEIPQWTSLEVIDHED